MLRKLVFGFLKKSICNIGIFLKIRYINTNHSQDTHKDY